MGDAILDRAAIIFTGCAVMGLLIGILIVTLVYVPRDHKDNIELMRARLKNDKKL